MGNPPFTPRVCIATSDIVGPIRNGGIGTHYTTLAETLARAGQTVTLLYTLGNYYENKDEAYWRAHFQAKGITFVPVPDESAVKINAPDYLAKPYLTYLWLKAHQDQFDIVHFHEWRGYGAYCVMAKRQGLAFQNLTLCVGTHSPTLWLKAGNAELADNLAYHELDHLERVSVALADVVHSPSAYMLAWITAQGWRLPETRLLQQYILPHAARQTTKDGGRKAAASHPPSSIVNELVFFGRLETRKGLVLFCDALDRLAAEGMSGFTVTFLGKLAQVDGQGSAEYLARRAEAWPWSWQIVSDKDQPEAMRYLRGGGRLAVMPSLLDNLPLTVLECLGATIPFVAGATGGIPEMIAAEDAPAALFPLRAADLADRLRACLAEGARTPHPAVDFEGNEQAWIRWHTEIVGRGGAARVAPPLPTISVCLITHNRPALLRQAVESLRRQDYPNFEVVLVDDGSTWPEAIQYLEVLEPKFAGLGWRVVRQANAYLGAARNTAARHARGEYLLFMDDDNVAKPHELSTLAHVAAHSGADIVSCFMDLFRGEAAPTASASPESRWLFIGGAPVVGVFRNCFGDANALIRKSVFESLGGYTEDVGITHEDWELLAKAVLAGHSLTVVPEALFWYRVSASSMLRSTNQYANTLRHLRPFQAAVPAALSPLIEYTQGLTVAAEALARSAAYHEGMCHGQRAFMPVAAALGGVGALLEQHLEKPAMEKLLRALDLARASKQPWVIVNGLLEAAEMLAHFKLLNQARPLMEEAYRMADQLGFPTEKKRAAERLTAMTPAPTRVPVTAAAPSAQDTFAALLATQDLPAFLTQARARGALTPELSALIARNAQTARAQGERELAEGLEALAAVVISR
jgi:GT2 family glycosyltransferase/glycosyltransferase involved in cell wall biosynthesis